MIWKVEAAIQYEFKAQYEMQHAVLIKMIYTVIELIISNAPKISFDGNIAVSQGYKRVCFVSSI